MSAIPPLNDSPLRPAAPNDGARAPADVSGTSSSSLSPQPPATSKDRNNTNPGDASNNTAQRNLRSPLPLDSATAAASSARLAALDANQIGIDIFDFMAVFQRMAQTLRDVARGQRETQLQAEVTSLHSAAAEMKNAAQSRLAAGISQGVGSIVGGSLQIAGAALATGQAAKGAVKTTEANELALKLEAATPAETAKLMPTVKPSGLDANNTAGNAVTGGKPANAAASDSAAANDSSTNLTANQKKLDVEKKSDTDSAVQKEKLSPDQIEVMKRETKLLEMEAKLAFANLDAWQARGQAGSAVGSGAGGIVGAALTLMADEADSRKAEREANSRTAGAATQQSGEMMQEMMEIIRDVRDKMQAIQQATIEANRGIARNI